MITPSSLVATVAQARRSFGIMPLADDPREVIDFDRITGLFLDMGPDAVAKTLGGLLDSRVHSEYAGRVVGCALVDLQDRSDFDAIHSADLRFAEHF